MSDTTDLLDRLIEAGEKLAPQGGSVMGYNGELQPDYAQWRYQALDAIEAIGPRTKRILADLQKDTSAQYFYASQARKVLGGLKAARALASQGTPADSGQATQTKPTNKTPTKAFIVHGHAETLREQVARFISQLGVRPIILMEQAHQGRTIVEKLEASKDVGYAIVLCTGDDVGRHKEAPEFLPRARQNVILEIGYFIGCLGRENVCVLVEPGVEMPSDLHGVGYHEVDPAGGWRFQLAREMKAANFDIDLNKAL